MTQVAEMKLQCTFIGWPGVALAIALTAVCLVVGWPAARQAASDVGAWRLKVLAIMLVLASLAVGVFLFERKELNHGMWQWTTWDYARVMGKNVLYLFGTVTAVAVLVLPPEVIGGKGFARRGVFHIGVCCICYFVAFLAYFFLLPDIQE
jgi:hypothetical protein